MNAGSSRVMQLVAAFAVAFVAVSALALLLGEVWWFRLRPMPRMDLWALGLLIVTPIVSVLVFVGAFLGSRDRTRATVPTAGWAGIIVAVPLVIGFEIVEFWSTFVGPSPWFILIAMAAWSVGAPWYFMRANSALLTDAKPPPI